MINSFIQSSNQIATTIEIGFNVADSVPVVGAVTAAGRVLASFVQMIAFGILDLICLAGEAFHSTRGYSFESRNFHRLGKLAEEQIGHGVLNLIRSCLELLGQSLTFGIANIIFNLSQEAPFAPIIDYEGVKGRSPLKGY